MAPMAPDILADDEDDPLYTVNEAAARLACTAQALANARSQGRGPKYTKLARHPGVFYRASDLLVYELDRFLAKARKNKRAA